jgi:hypothetical protein
MRERVAVGLGVALVLAALVAVLSQRHQRLAGSNSEVGVSAYAVRVRAGAARCQVGEVITKDASALRLFAGTYGKPGSALQITISGAGGELTHARVAGGYRSGPLRVPIERVARDDASATLCVRNLGKDPVRFAGNLTPFLAATQHPGRLPDNIRVDYLRKDREPWWAVAPAVASRFGLVKTSFFGSWTLWFALGLVALSSMAAITLVLRQPR